MLLSQTDIKKDVNGNAVRLVEGLPIAIFSDDIGADGQPDNLVADGVVIRNKYTGSFPHVKWCCLIRACLQLSRIIAEANWTPARNILASLS